jgi:hypothetical protein
LITVLLKETSFNTPEPEPLIRATSALDFGDAVVGQSKPETVSVTLSNAVSDEDELSFSLVGGNESVYSLSFDEDEVTVTFTPLAAVKYKDTLII